MGCISKRFHSTSETISLVWALVACSTMAYAHSEGGVASGLVSGFLHPITGLDHVAAMVAVGIWGAVLGAPAIWLLPVCFPLAMAFGGILGIKGMPLPYAEHVIALSGIVLGGLILANRKLPLLVASVLVGVFAIFHGHAHGVELPRAADPMAYSMGFVIGTGLMHMCGIAVGLVNRWSFGPKILKLAGGVIAATGAFFLFKAAGG